MTPLYMLTTEALKPDGTIEAKSTDKQLFLFDNLPKEKPPVVQLDCYTRLPITVEATLEGAKDLDRVIILGYTEEGHLYIASSEGTRAELIFTLVMAQNLILRDYE